MPEGPWCPPTLPGDASSGPLSRGSTSHPGRLGSWLGDCSFDHASQATRARVREPAVSSRYPGASGPCPRPRGFNQLSEATQARFRGPTGSTIGPGRFALGSNGPKGSTSSAGRLGTIPKRPRGRPAVPSDSGPVPMLHGVDQLSRVTGARARGPTVSPDVMGDSGPSLRTCDEIGRASCRERV